MKDIPSKSIDMILCDLPYGVTQNPCDKKLPYDELWKEYKRIIKDNGAIVLFGQGKFYIELVESNRKWFRYDLVWDKVLISGFLNANRMPLRRHEQIAVFYKKLPKYRPQFTEGQPLHGRGKAYKDKAMKMLKAKLYLIKQQENLDKISDIRGEVTDNGWGSQIRSYVLQPYTMVKDHRTSQEIGNAQAVLDGDLDSFINAYLKWVNTTGKEE